MSYRDRPIVRAPIPRDREEEIRKGEESTYNNTNTKNQERDTLYRAPREDRKA